MKPQKKPGLIGADVQQTALLKQAEDKIEARLTPDIYTSYMKLVIAGMKAAMNGGPNGVMGSIKRSKTPLESVVKGMISLMLMLKDQAKGQVPVNALVPATMAMVLQGLAFANNVGVLKVGAPEIAQATHLFINTIMPKLGLTQDKVEAVVGQVRNITSDPQKLAALKQAQLSRGQPKAMQQPIGQ